MSKWLWIALAATAAGGAGLFLYTRRAQAYTPDTGVSPEIKAALAEAAKGVRQASQAISQGRQKLTIGSMGSRIDAAGYAANQPTKESAVAIATAHITSASQGGTTGQMLDKVSALRAIAAMDAFIARGQFALRNLGDEITKLDKASKYSTTTKNIIVPVRAALQGSGETGSSLWMRANADFTTMLYPYNGLPLNLIQDTMLANLGSVFDGIAATRGLSNSAADSGVMRAHLSRAVSSTQMIIAAAEQMYAWCTEIRQHFSTSDVRSIVASTFLNSIAMPYTNLQLQKSRLPQTYTDKSFTALRSAIKNSLDIAAMLYGVPGISIRQLPARER